MIKNDMVKRSIDYILQHLDEEISIEDVADHCHFSKYYFSRIFKSETGESVYSFIKRLKMEQSAVNLKLEKDRSITDIGLEYGYSSSNFSSAFRNHLNISPAGYRKSIDRASVLHPFCPGEYARFETFEEYDRKVQIQQLDDFIIICERYIGNYNELGENWSVFTEKYKDYLKADTLLIERFYDDPSITSVDQCLYDLCMTVDPDCLLDNVTSIQGGKFAVYRFDGLVEHIFAALQGMFRTWLANSGYEMDERYGLDIYRSIDRASMRVAMDFCIPVK